MTHKIEFSDHVTSNVSAWGEQYTQVHCVATINGEAYQISYHRSPISGELRSVQVADKPEEQTTEKTLTAESVKDLCWDELQN